MKKIVGLVLLLICVFALVSCSPNPPAQTIASREPLTWVEVTNAEPETLDPSLSYESAGAEILQNTLDNLIFVDQDSSTEFIPMLALEVPTRENGGISSDGLSVTFDVRDGVVFHDGSALKPQDVAFTFIRNILAGGTNSPQWMLVEPIYGAGLTDIAEVLTAADKGVDFSDPIAIQENMSDAIYDDRVSLSATYDAEILEAVCEDLKTRITADEAAGTVTFKLAQPWAPFLSTLAGGSWGGIQSMDWVADNGGWDGDCQNWVPYYGWTADEFNQTPLGTRVMGTGPYELDEWRMGDSIILNANPYYWVEDALWEDARTGPAFLETITIKQVPDAQARIEMAVNGDADNVIDNSARYWDNLEEFVGEEYTYREWMEGLAPFSPGADKPLRKITGIPVVNARSDIGFQFSINPDEANTFIGSGKLDGNGIPVDFFQDVHVRRAFSFCFDYDRYLETVHLGEGTRAPTLMLPGMSGYDINAPRYSYDIEKCRAELTASEWTTCTYLEREAEQAAAAVLVYSEEDPSVTLTELEGAAVAAREAADACEVVPLIDAGFRLAMVYDTGSVEHQAMAEIMQAGFQRVGEQFIVEAVGLPWKDYERSLDAMKAPIFAIDWLSDYNDAHNWLSAFTCSYYPFRQGFPEEDRQAFCDIAARGVQILDAEERDQFYKDVFNPAYHQYAPAILLFNLEQREYQPRYVRGWYANAAYANKWYYSLWKE